MSDSAGALAQIYEALGIEADEHRSVLYVHKDDGIPRATVCDAATVADALAAIPAGANAYFGLNPTSLPLGNGHGRGGDDDVTRVVGLPADLDYKQTGCGSHDNAQSMIETLAEIMGTGPTFDIFSGHGLQPVWALDDCTPDEGKRLLDQWGRLVHHVAEVRNLKVDPVFDPARVLRIPNTLNHKEDPPVEAALIMDTGAPLTVTEAIERMTEYGIHDDYDESQDGREPVVPQDDWKWAVQVCPYAEATTQAWIDESVDARHPWALCCYVRLECMRRNGCLTREKYQQVSTAIERRFLALLKSQQPQRDPGKYELRDIRRTAIQRAEGKTDSQLGKELGRNTQLGLHIHPPTLILDAATSVPINGFLNDIIAIERDFWQRESLRLIYDTALGRMRSPWAVLACCAARALALVDSSVTLPPLTGGPGSLNWIAALVSPSGGGKGASNAIARDLVNQPVRVRNLGSGEGMIDAYFDKVCNERHRVNSVLFLADEVDTFAALKSRSGATLSTVIRSAFMGEQLGFSTKTSNHDHLDAHSYRMAAILSVQPARAATLVEDSDGGTPQRIMWFPTRDLRVPRRPAKQCQFQPTLELPNAIEMGSRREIQIPDVAADEIIEHAYLVNQGNVNELDGHALFCREKFAFALAVMDGRMEMTEDDWRLSGIAADVSTMTRSWMLAELEKADAEQNAKDGRALGRKSSAASAEKLHQDQARLNRIADWTVDRLGEAGVDGLTESAVRREANSRDRAYLTGSLFEELCSQSRIERVGTDRWRKI